MTDLVWLGNYIVPRWEALLVVGVMIVVAVFGCLFVIGLIGALISWLVNPRAKPGKQ